MKKYAICRNGNKITVKRTDRDYDLGEVINERDTLPEARLCAKVERMVCRHVNRAVAEKQARRNEMKKKIEASVTFHISYHGEIAAGFNGYSDEITVTCKSGEWGGSPGEFEEHMRNCLSEWYDGATVTRT
jgi:hypothetical protein